MIFYVSVSLAQQAALSFLSEENPVHRQAEKLQVLTSEPRLSVLLISLWAQ